MTNGEMRDYSGWRFFSEIIHSYRGVITLLLVLAAGWMSHAMVAEYLLATDATALRVSHLEMQDSLAQLDRADIRVRVEDIENKLDYMICLTEHDPRILSLLHVNCRVTPDLR